MRLTAYQGTASAVPWSFYVLHADAAISDTYSVSSNDRFTLGSGNMVFYIVSPTKVVGVNVDSTNPEPTTIVVKQ